MRTAEAEIGRPLAVLADLQGPKFRLGVFKDGRIDIAPGQMLRLDLDPKPGDRRRVSLPHPEVFEVLRQGMLLLLDDGKVRLRVKSDTAPTPPRWRWRPARRSRTTRGSPCPA